MIGRSSRFVKMYGLRIDLQRVEATLRDHGVTAFCTDVDDRLAVAATGVTTRLRSNAPPPPLPVSRPAPCRPSPSTELPMLPSGKPDYQAVRDLARASNTDESDVIGLRELFADVLQIDADSIDPDASFVDLGGNSLSYVTMSVRLERALGAAARRLAAAAAAGAGSHAQAGATVVAVVGCDAGDQRRAARRRDRAHRRIARRVVRTVGRRAPAARHRRLQLRPVLPHAGAAHRPGAAPAQHHRVDRGAVGGRGSRSR